MGLIRTGLYAGTQGVVRQDSKKQRQAAAQTHALRDIAAQGRGFPTAEAERQDFNAKVTAQNQAAKAQRQADRAARKAFKGQVKAARAHLKATPSDQREAMQAFLRATTPEQKEASMAVYLTAVRAVEHPQAYTPEELEARQARKAAWEAMTPEQRTAKVRALTAMRNTGK
jgi:hypothetical protein